MAALRILVGFAATLFAGIAACSLSPTGTGPSGGDGAAAGSGGSPAAGSGGSAGASSTGTAGTGGADAVTSSTTSSATTSTSSGAGGEGGAPALPSEVNCDKEPCSEGRLCCAKPDNKLECKPGASCGPGFPMRCDGKEDCGDDQLCCGTLSPDPRAAYTAVTCATTCDGIDQRVLCHRSNEGTDCPTGLDCLEESLFGEDYGFCGPTDG